jgi:hypothetical protein
MNYPKHTPKMAELLWGHVDEWSTAAGREWRDGENKHSRVEKPPLMQKYTVTFEVPPLHAAPAGQFLREAAKKSNPNVSSSEYGLPSDLDLINTAAENAELLDALHDIGDICIEHFVISGTFDEKVMLEARKKAMDDIQKLVSNAVRNQSAGSGFKILERMHLQHEAIQEKRVDVAAELLRQIDDSSDKT